MEYRSESSVPSHDSLLRAAAEKYGDDADFAYRAGDTTYILKLEEVLQICGDHIVAASERSPEQLWSMLDKFHEAARRIDALSGIHGATARALGKQVLTHYQR